MKYQHWKQIERAVDSGWRFVLRVSGPVRRLINGPKALRLPVPLPPLPIHPGPTCARCGNPLPAGKKRWCSQDCRDQFEEGFASIEQRAFLRKIGIALAPHVTRQEAREIIEASDQRGRSFWMGDTEPATQAQISLICELHREKRGVDAEPEDFPGLTMQDASLLISNLLGEEI